MRRVCSVWLSILLVACGAADPGASDGATDPPAGDAGAEDAGPPPRTTAPTLPEPTGACPETFANGRVTVSPEGIAPREVQVWIGDAAAELDGPLVFYWHGTGSRPEEAEYGLGPDTMEAILAAGGMVVAPIRDPEAGDFPWYLTAGTGDDDLRVADEVVACAMETVGIDPMRIHSIGMSAGGLHTTQMGYRRSSYIASVVAYSGGLYLPRLPPIEDPANRFSALMFHGGESDVVIIGFEDATERYHADLTARGHVAFICDHGSGHTIPTAARASVWAFFQAHPFGAESPWSEGLPADFYDRCSLTP